MEISANDTQNFTLDLVPFDVFHMRRFKDDNYSIITEYLNTQYQKLISSQRRLCGVIRRQRMDPSPIYIYQEWVSIVHTYNIKYYLYTYM